jgi:hypothetical protein
MSDRPQGSVRTEARTGDGAGPAGQPSGEPVSATQSIPTAGDPRAQSPNPETSPGAGPASGAAPAVPVSGQPRPPVVPPAGAPAGGQTRPPAGVPSGGPSSGAPSGGPSSGAPSGRPGVRPAGATKPGRGRAGRGPRRARLQLRHIDTWSAFKISLVLSIALFFIWMVAIAILYGVLSALGVFNTLNDLFGQLGSASGTSKAASDVISGGIVFGGAAVIGAINIILMTALCTVGTFIYNMCADLVGGLEVTLSERD